MSGQGQLRGHEIIFVNGAWSYKDTGVSVLDTYKDRACGRCGKLSTEKDHDFCISNLPGVVNACCGHGEREESYIQFENGVVIRNFKLSK